ncbi:MAG: TPM domain-containing protein [Candidatus Accumulibacter phosphatis]|jgi:uncharacterized protein|uniref:TPM domain-containing protein n=1 Tax=Candidatus Accumulibacter sp. ACC012 TaxID=2823332 RepID=UPI0025C0DA4E|nr:TPM domain-containing protein [Candidatus Accumulibacter sp. ACC012]
MSRLPASCLPGWLLSLFLLFGAAFAAGAEQAIPVLAAPVTDLTGTLTGEQRAALDGKLAALDRQKGAQIAVLIVASVKPEAIEQYALRVAEAWKLGRQGIDDGALLLIAKEDRRLRIEVGYGLEGALNDATAKRIISELITPRFKQGDFYGGVDAGIEAMLKVVAGEPLPAPVARASKSDSGDRFETLLFAGFILVFVVGAMLRAIFGRFLAAGMVAAAAGVIASFLLSSLLVAAIIAVVAFFVSLLVGIAGARGGIPGGVSWGGRRGGGSGRGGGGFSGGGGGFGGGGASGGW